MSNIAAPVGDDVNPDKAQEQLGSRPDAQLVDVRTRGEWERVGVPDLSGLGKSPIFLEWQVAPTMQVAPDFLDRLEAELKARGLGHDTPLYFLCRSGVRSAAAASAAAAAGFTETHNVVEGFEGPASAPPPAGWRARGLPCTQF